MRHTEETINVVIGTPIYRQGAYVINKFLDNQKEIQQKYPSSELVLATCEHDFVGELTSSLTSWQLRGQVLSYETVKPTYSRSRTWNVTCGREAIRQYTLTRTKARYLLFLDADMVFESSVVNKMEREIQGHDVLFTGCPLRDYGTGLAGTGCVMLSRRTLEKLKFRCFEFRNGQVICADSVLEIDLFRLGSRVKKGFFVCLNHYVDTNVLKQICPQPVGRFRRIANRPIVRYCLIAGSIMLHYNIPLSLKIILYRFFHSAEK